MQVKQGQKEESEHYHHPPNPGRRSVFLGCATGPDHERRGDHGQGLYWRPLGEDSRARGISNADHGAEHLECISHGVCTEEDPSNDHQYEGQEILPGHGECSEEAPLAGKSLEDQPEALVGAPRDEGPSGAMSESPEQHGRREVDVGP